MQVISAKDAKLRFGELLDTMQREPVLLTKNNRPVGVFVSLNDVKGTHLEQLFNPPNTLDYTEDDHAKILTALQHLQAQPDQCRDMHTVHAQAMQKARELLTSRNR